MSHNVHIDRIMVMLEKFIKKGVDNDTFEIIRLETYPDLTTRESVFRTLFSDSKNEMELEYRISEEFQRMGGLWFTVEAVGLYFVSEINKYYKEDKTHGK